MHRTALVLPLLCALTIALLLSPGPGPSAPAPPVRAQLTNSIGMKLVLVPAGKFLMGSPKDEKRQEGELQHEVELTRPYFLGAYEVTQAQYQKVMRTNPSHFSPIGGGRATVAGLDTNDFPVENTSWNDADAFCKKLSALAAEKAARRTYRLPTSAEWERACRGGAGAYATFHHGMALSSRDANIDGTSPNLGAPRSPSLGRTCKVGSYKPNAYGLFDMHGNVFEWCADWHELNYYRTSPKKDPAGPATGNMRRLRGGGWMYNDFYARSAFRGWNGADYRGNVFGFRVACDVGAAR